MGAGTFFAVNERILKSLKIDNDSIEKIKKCVPVCLFHIDASDITDEIQDYNYRNCGTKDITLDDVLNYGKALESDVYLDFSEDTNILIKKEFEKLFYYSGNMKNFSDLLNLIQEALSNE